MIGHDEPETEPTPSPAQQRTPLPPGYREGIITAITVLLGFSLTFFRFWGFEAEGQWTFPLSLCGQHLDRGCYNADHCSVSIPADCR